MQPPQFIVVSGLPASGKSTLGRTIAGALGLPMLDKDEILEGLFESRGVGDADWRTKLSRLADEELCRRAHSSAGAVITSWWKHPHSESISGTPVEWIRSLPGPIVELHCSCSPQIAAARFVGRRRHAGHLDGRCTPTALLASFEQQAALGPLALGRVIYVNTGIVSPLAALVAELSHASIQKGTRPNTVASQVTPSK
jgi:AAA domain